MPTPTPDLDPFRRPTLLDLAVLVLASGLGMAGARGVGVLIEWEYRYSAGGPRFTDASMLVLGLALTLALAPPALFVERVVVRKRRGRLGLGEILGFAGGLTLFGLVGCLLVPGLVKLLASPAMVLLMVWALIALIGYPASLLQGELRRSLRWNDHLGFLAALLILPLLIVGVILIE